MPQEPAPPPPPPPPPPPGPPPPPAPGVPLPGPGYDATATTAPPAPRVDFQVGATLRRSFAIWLRNYVPFTAISVVLAAPFFAFSVYLVNVAPDNPETRLLVQLLQMGQQTVVGVLLIGVFTYAVFRQLRGQPATMGRCLAIAFSRLLPMLAVMVIYFLAIAGGCILFCVPGVIALAALWITVPIAVVERAGILGSLQRSIDLTRGTRLPILGLILLLLVGIGIVTVAAQLVFGGNLLDPATESRRTIVGGVVQTLLGALYPVANVVTYHDLRVAKEGVGTDELLRVFE